MPEKRDAGMDARQMPFLENIGLFVTYRCQAACPHCVAHAGPSRTEEMRPRDAAEWLGQIARYQGHRVRAIDITGGEPFIDLEKLGAVVADAGRRGLVATAVTNAFWASTPTEAKNVLKSLPHLLFLQISADRYHQMTVPLERVKNAVIAAQELGLEYRVAVCCEGDGSAGDLGILRDLETVLERDRIRLIRTIPAGRGAFLKSDADLVAEPPLGACDSAATPIIFPNGRVLACIGPIMDIPGDHPLVLGDLRTQTLQEILDRAARNPLLHFLRVWGPSGLYEMLSQLPIALDLPARFVPQSICSLCHDLLRRPEVAEALIACMGNARLRREIEDARYRFLHELPGEATIFGE